jgi:signal transduction histidine kinase
VHQEDNREFQNSLPSNTDERYRALLNALDEGFCIIEVLFDSDGKPYDYLFIETNSAFEDQTGIRQAVGKSMREIAPNHEAHWFEIYGDVARTGKPLRFENEARELNRFYDVYAFPIESCSSRVGVLFKDISQRKRADDAVLRSLELEASARRAAEEANRLRDEFLAFVTHELRTPLSAILGWIALLRSGRSDEAGFRHALDVIERNAQLQHRLIEDLMDLSRAIMGKMRIDMHPIQLADVIEAAVNTVRPAAEARKIELRLALDPAVQVCADEARLQQVFWNLLSNAVKFTPPGGHVDVRMTLLNSEIQIVVADNGEGIEPEFLPHVFERFSQAAVSAPSKSQAGLGLGLAIVRHLVELHGGTVRAESAGKGRGASFSVRLPADSSACRKDTAA